MGALNQGRDLLGDLVGLGKLADGFLSDWVLSQPTWNCLFLFCELGLCGDCTEGKGSGVQRPERHGYG